MRGFSLLGAVVAIGIAGALSLAVPVLVGANTSLRTTQLQASQAYYSARAALEYAERQIRSVNNPLTLPSKSFMGYAWNFTRGSNLLQISTTFGGASKSFSITDPSPESSNLVVNTASASANGNKKLIGITLQNSGIGTVIINSMTISWVANPSSVVLDITINGTSLFTSSGVSSGTTCSLSPVFTMSNNTVYSLDQVLWNNNGVPSTITIVFNLSDGTTKSVTVTV